MSLISVLIVLCIFGVLLYLVNAYIPIDARLKMLFNIIIVLAICVWLLQAFGVLSSLESMRIR